MSRANGYFEAFVNRHADRPGADERALIDAVSQVVRGVVPSSQVRWAGSQRKGTAIAGSDLDLCVESGDLVTERQRRDLRAALALALGRPAVVLSHAVRLPATAASPKVDISFANAVFGSRPLPDTAPFHARPARQTAARAFKLWTRDAPLPRVPGWAVEAVVLHLDQAPSSPPPLDLFLRIVAWLDERATPAAVEGVLRPAASPRWDPAWSGRLSGRLEALRSHARALRRRTPAPDAWTCTDDVGRWLGR